MIEVQDLTIDYETASGRLRAADAVSFTLAPSEVLGLVGESGSGKSTVALALLGHVAATARLVRGQVLLRGENLLSLPPALLAASRGRRIGFVPQNPAAGLSPHLRVGGQFVELVLQHGVVGSRQEAMTLARDQFALVGLPEPHQLVRRYPHELSGGQQQRVCIAMAVACRPELLVLDEPTTGLDVTTQARIIDLLKDLRSRFDIGMLYVTHDLGVLAQIADRVGVMYAGRLVEIARADRLFSNAGHPYSRGLIASVASVEGTTVRARRLRGMLRRKELPAGCAFFPRCDQSEPSCADRPQALECVSDGHSVACQRWKAILTHPTATVEAETQSVSSRTANPAPLVRLDDVSITYDRRSVWRRLLGCKDKLVVKDLTFSIGEGEIVGLVGESGSGKSTIARALSGLLAPVRGDIRFRGLPLPRLADRSLDLRRDIQYVFQNPDASLNPRERVHTALSRPLLLYFKPDHREADQRTRQILQEVHLEPSYATRFPDQLSGGERQRVALARALVARPAVILCDEILSALDVSVQASIIELLAGLRRETGVAMLFISHDLAVVRHLADQTGVLFRGALVEFGRTEMLFQPPFHPYTEELLLAVPAYRKQARRSRPSASLKTRTPSSHGCVYASRCQHHRGRICDEEVPPWRHTVSGHAIRCHIPLSELENERVIGIDEDGARLAAAIS